MPILNNAARAVIDKRKLRDYVLNLAHPVGGHKARVIAAATGLGRGDHAELAAQIRAGVLAHDAEAIEPIAFGERFRVVPSIRGPSGTLRVRTGWIVRKGEDVPRLATVYPLDETWRGPADEL